MGRGVTDKQLSMLFEAAKTMEKEKDKEMSSEEHSAVKISFLEERITKLEAINFELYFSAKKEAEKKADKGETKPCNGNPFYCACVEHQDTRENLGLQRITKTPEETIKDVALVLEMQHNRLEQARNDLAMGTKFSEKEIGLSQCKTKLTQLIRDLMALTKASVVPQTSTEAPTSHGNPVEVSEVISEEKTSQNANGALWGMTEPQSIKSNRAYPRKGCDCINCADYRRSNPDMRFAYSDRYWGYVRTVDTDHTDTSKLPVKGCQCPICEQERKSPTKSTKVLPLHFP